MASVVEPAIDKKYGRYPSSAAMSYRSVSPEGGDMQSENKAWWKSVKNSLVSGALVAVGLKPTEDERRHWTLMEAFASKEDQTETDEIDGVSPTSPGSVEADSGPSGPPLAYTPSLLMRQVTKYSLAPEQQVRNMKSLKQNKATGRNQAVNTNLRPDLWRVVLDSVRTRSKKSDIDEKPSGKVSFQLGEIESESEEEEEEEEVVAGGEVEADGLDEVDGIAATRRRFISESKVQREDELFFDLEIGDQEKKERERMKKERERIERERLDRERLEDEGRYYDMEGGRDEPDSAPAPRRVPSTLPSTLPRQGSSINIRLQPEKEKEAEESVRKNERGVRLELKKLWGKATLSGGYLEGYGGLGGITKLLRFQYTEIPKKKQELLDARFLHK